MSANPSQARLRPAFHLVFIALAIFTAVEVGVSYLAPAIKIPVLIILSGVKAVLVALYFMHLKFDRRIYVWPFLIGLVVIIPIVLILTVVMPKVL
ncbi:MAG TPA: cytochrome C oxidase subunit IV family protein [Anaerolineales bacterium]|nr:cytochrome C oxidase subunit IV family protein [Anaerolineales bacterium]